MFRTGEEVEVIGSGNPIPHFMPIGRTGTIREEVKVDSVGQEYYTVKSHSPARFDSYLLQRISPADLRALSYDTNENALHLLHRKEHV